MASRAAAQVGGYSDLPAVPAGAHIHIVGIGGSGMSAIARVLLERGGYRISGSDRDLSEAGHALVDLGAEVFAGHRAAQVGDADLVFVSSAIPPDNVEVQAAWEKGIPVVKRPQVLAWLTQPYRTIAVAGTHGKTTTTAMIAQLLLQAGLDPSCVIGGVVPSLGANARAGRGRFFVIEADEYDRTFLALRPVIAVVTNVEMDHPDCYPSYADVQVAFGAFLGGVARDGCVVACVDDQGVVDLLEGLAAPCRVVRYGLGAGCDIGAAALRNNGRGHDFGVVVDGSVRGRLSLQVPGVHNVRNALAVVSVARELQLDEGVTRQVLESFLGVSRRFELKGEVAGITVIDDYAHHPSEIRATLAAARARYPERSIWAVFQPHTFSRTQVLLEEYKRSFGDADHVLVTPIYASRERDDRGVSSSDLVRGADHTDVRCVSALQEAVDTLVREMKAGDVVVIMGAGDSCRVGEGVLSVLRERVK
jgi:UDP-N-acetylmuramate--alanine ligase